MTNKGVVGGGTGVKVGGADKATTPAADKDKEDKVEDKDKVKLMVVRCCCERI